MTSADHAERLRFVECSREQAVGERGWRAYLTVDEDEPVDAIAVKGRAERSACARPPPGPIS